MNLAKIAAGLVAIAVITTGGKFWFEHKAETVRREAAINADAAARLRFDGVYHTLTQAGYHYLRFYPDGAVISAFSKDEPGDLENGFVAEQEGAALRRARFTFTGGQLIFALPSDGGAVEYLGDLDADRMTLISKLADSEVREQRSYQFLSGDAQG